MVSGARRRAAAGQGTSVFWCSTPLAAACATRDRSSGSKNSSPVAPTVRSKRARVVPVSGVRWVSVLRVERGFLAVPL